MSLAITHLQAQIQALQLKIDEAQGLLTDPTLAALAQEEIKTLTSQINSLKASLELLQNPTSIKSAGSDSTGTSMDHANAILEVRGGAGGDEAKIFADDLLRMYLKYAEAHRFKIEPLDDGVVKIKGKNAYGTFKYESGVHRVQRVPVTESSGRIHTSTASVAVLPEIPPSSITVRDEDLEWKFSRAGGHGGQNVNKVSTAVTLTHRSSRIVVHCRQERYQQQNKVIALDLLRSQLWQIEEDKRLAAIESTRKSAVGRAMRSEKIRTYNFPENRVTDHRLKKTWKSLDTIMGGNLDPLFSALTQAASPTS